jgi:hypothetical protein
MVQMASLSNGAANVWGALASYPPAFVQDHVLALCSWLVLYMAESAGLRALLRGESVARNSVVAWMSNLPKIILPLNLAIFKYLWLKNPYFSSALEETSHGVLSFSCNFLLFVMHLYICVVIKERGCRDILSRTRR